MFKITFDFNEKTKTVSNLKCEEMGSTKVSTETSHTGKPIVEVGENKLIISPEALNLIKATFGDRISINYIQKSNQITFPLIGKSEAFADKGAGNKLTKSNTVSFKGKQRTMLLEYGSVFELTTSDKVDTYKLVPVSDDSSTEVDLPELVEDLTPEEAIDAFDELDKLPF